MTQPTAVLKLITEDERKAVVRMALQFFEASPYQKYGVDPDEVNTLISTFINNRSTQTCFMLMVGDLPVGVLAALSAKNQFNKYKICAELIWWIDPSHRNFRNTTLMLNAYEYWAKDVIKAQIVQLACLDEKLHKLYTRRGFIRSEFAYVKEII